MITAFKLVKVSFCFGQSLDIMRLNSKSCHCTKLHKLKITFRCCTSHKKKLPNLIYFNFFFYFLSKLLIENEKLLCEPWKRVEKLRKKVLSKVEERKSSGENFMIVIENENKKSLLGLNVRRLSGTSQSNLNEVAIFN